MRLVGGGDDDVLAGAQAEALRHLAQVDVGLGAGLGGVQQEEVLLHVLLVSVHLEKTGGHIEALLLRIDLTLRHETKDTGLIMCGENKNSAGRDSLANVCFRVNALFTPSSPPLAPAEKQKHFL